VRPDRQQLAILAAFAAIYLIWGSTSLAIRIGLETLPPFLLAGVRFAAAGSLLYGWLRLRGISRPTDQQWWAAAFTGTLMLVCGVGGVTWAEQRVASGTAALLAATVPMWMTAIDTAIVRCSSGGWRVAAGLGIGLAGVAVLVGPLSRDLAAVDPVGAAVILAGAVCWSVGSLRSRRANLPTSPAMTVAVQMVTAGVVLLVLSSAHREWQHGFAIADISVRSAAALAYLAIVGSMVALCAYVWLLRRVPAPAVATYAFVNPVVAVFLGWALAGEPVGPRILLATALIVGAVAVIQSTEWRRASVAGDRARRRRERLELPGTMPAAEPAAADAPIFSLDGSPAGGAIPQGAVESFPARRPGRGGGTPIRITRSDRESRGCLRPRTAPEKATVGCPEVC
jgi:drug/metabolite transporter (DMT)-like permease